MKYHLFGRSGLRVSEICLGTMTFGEDFGWGTSKKECRQIFDIYANAGGNFIDTANYYTRGTSEQMLGEFLEGQREKFVVATKYALSTDPKDPNASGNGIKNMHQAVEASLKRLKTDYIDLYWVHVWDQVTPIEEVMRGLDTLVRLGKVLYVGLSDYPAWNIAEANTLAHMRGWAPVAGMQLEYSLATRGIEREHISLAKHHKMAIAAWSPLAMGVLTGKYLKQQDKKARFKINPGWGNNYLNDKNQAIAEEVIKIAKESERTPAQVAINWVRQHDDVNIIPIIGARNPKQLQDSLESTQFELSKDEIQRLNAVSAIELGFPYEFLNKPDIRRTVMGESEIVVK